MPERSRSGSPSPPAVTFTKKKNRAAARSSRVATSTSSHASLETPISSSAPPEHDPEEDEPTIVVRSKGIGTKKVGIKDKAKPIKKGLSFGDEQEEGAGDSAFQVRKSKLALASRASRVASDSNPPSSLDQASISNDLPGSIAGSAYSVSALAALKAATPSASTVRRRATSPNEHSAYTEIDDPMTEEDLTRNRFGNDYAHQDIPDAASIRSAKEKRAKAAASGSSKGGGISDDFISLGEGSSSSKRSKSVIVTDPSDMHQGPHPESRLQREEDDLGSGEDEFDQYTGASERIGLGRKAEKERERRRRQEIREAIGEEDQSLHDSEQSIANGISLREEGEDEDELEWERSQMDRWSLPGERQRKEGREKSPYLPAPIPHTAPLPTITSTSARLAARLKQLDDSAAAHSKVVSDSVLSMKQMDQEEKDNKELVEREGDKEAWFREFEEWAISVAGFLDEKLPPFEEIESDFTQLLSQRTRLSQIARCKDAEDELALFHGVPSLSLLPAVLTDARELSVTNGDQANIDREPAQDPSDDGDALSSTRENRRALASDTRSLSENEYPLSPADLSSFISESSSISQRLTSLFANVQSSVFQDPAARVSSASSVLNPSSIAARFSDWRAKYPQEYLGAWGGLALVGVWEFWARWEMLEWDPLRASAPRNLQSEPEIQSRSGPRGLDRFKWHSDLTLYTERHLFTSATPAIMDEDVSAIGGDDEAVATMISNIVVPKLCSIAERGAYDPWSFRDTRAILTLVEEVSYVLDREGWRFQSLIMAYLSTFRPHVNTVLRALSTPPASAPPGFHPSSIPARISFLRRLVTLLRNSIAWNRYCPETEKAGYADLVDQLLGRGMWSLIRESKLEGGSAIAKEILSIVPPHLLAADIKTRLESVL